MPRTRGHGAPIAGACRRRFTPETSAIRPNCFGSSASKLPPPAPSSSPAYRRLAAQHHPDKVFGASAEVQTAAAARFIEITRAYETLLVIYDE